MNRRPLAGGLVLPLRREQPRWSFERPSASVMVTRAVRFCPACQAGRRDGSPALPSTIVPLEVHWQAHPTALHWRRLGRDRSHPQPLEL